MPTLTAVEKVTLLHIAFHCDKRGEHSHATCVRQLVQRLAPDARITDKAEEVQGAFGHLTPDAAPIVDGVIACPTCHRSHFRCTRCNPV